MRSVLNAGEKGTCPKFVMGRKITRKSRVNEPIPEHGKLNHPHETVGKQKGTRRSFREEEDAYAATMYHIQAGRKPKALKHDLPAMVVKSPGPNYLGRNWLQVIKFMWNSIFNIQEINPQLQKILDAHKNVFGKGLGTLKGTKAKIYVDPGVDTQVHESSSSTLCP
ncbi:hypothetical protein ACROYT_G006355 [Oculina patagonica]